MKNAQIIRAAAAFFAAAVIFSGCATTPRYSLEEANSMIEDNYNRMAGGETQAIDTELLDFLYEERTRFPQSAEDADQETRLGDMVQPYNLLSQMFMQIITINEGEMTLESAKLFAFLQHLGTRMIPEMTAFMALQDPEAPEYQVRLQGQDQAYIGLANNILGNIIVLYVQSEDAEVNEVLRDAVNAYGPELMAGLPVDYRDQIFAFLEMNVAPEVSEEDKAGYDQLIAHITPQL